jgi:cyclophilin family peptidyl-prolyl cis-trans isomerase
MATLLTLSVAACNKNTATDKTKTDAANTTDTKPTDPKAATPAAATPAAKPATPVAPTVTTPGAIPSGYSLVPFVSAKPIYKFASEPARSLKDATDYYALIDTSKGQLLADLYEDKTPVTVNNFVTLARNHFYDGLKFHRVLEGFMSQTGDPNSLDISKKASWGQGGPGYSFPDEIRQSLKFDAPGELAMANSGPDTNGSQFFMTFAPVSFLDGKYNLFGKVVSGQDVLNKLTRTANSGAGGETPIEGVTPDSLLSVRILSKNK